MVKFLFWNLGKQSRNERITELVRSQQVDVLLLAEFVEQPIQFAERLSTDLNIVFQYHQHPASEKVYLFSRFSADAFKPIEGASEYRCDVFHYNGHEILIVALHLIAKFNLYLPDDEQHERSKEVSHEIRLVEKKLGRRHTIAVGDFNMNPFDRGMVDARAFNAVMDRRIAKEGVRRIRKTAYPYFYNPMWNCLGDNTPDPPGTHYYKASDGVCYYWNTLDQVLLRPDLLSHFDEGNVKILNSTGEKSLLNTAGFPNRKVGSDHLPLLFQVNI